MSIKIGDSVTQKGKYPFEGLKGKKGVVIKKHSKPFFYYNVKFGKMTYEFHKGELKRWKK